MNLEIRPVDQAVYESKLQDFLPPRMIDVHSHVWRKMHRIVTDVQPRGPTWPGRVAEEGPVEDLLETYRRMFPQQRVTPVIFGAATRNYDLATNNDYVSECARQNNLPSLMVITPEWTPQELEQRALRGGFLGFKPYLEFAPPHIPSERITIFDFLSREHLEVADAHGWMVMLHIPRPGRLQDPVNIEGMLEIEQTYRNIQLIIAHIGRAYCPEDVGDALEKLAPARRMNFDFSANTNSWVMEQLLRAVGPQRVVFGSDLPIVRMRMRRICESGFYVNLVPPGMYGDVSNDAHMREVDPAEGERLSFFMYEELQAFRRAAEAVGLSRSDVADVMYNNAARLIRSAGGTVD